MAIQLGWIENALAVYLRIILKSVSLSTKLEVFSQLSA